MAGRRLIQNALWNLVPYAWGFALNLLAVRIVVDRIGVGEFGLFGLLAAVLAPLTLANLGFGEATVKYVAGALHRNDLQEAGRYARTTLAQNLGVGVLGAVALAVVGPWVVGPLFHLGADAHHDATLVLRWIALGWIGTQAAGVFFGITAASQRFRLVAIGIASTQTLVALGGGVGATLGGLGGYAAGTATGTIAGGLVWLLLVRQVLPGISLRPTVDPVAWREAFRFGGWQTIANLGTIAANQTERLLLGIFLTPSAVGYYNISQTFEQRVYAAVYALSQVLFPHFATLEEAPPERKAELLLRASWLLTALAVCVLAPLIPLAHPLLGIWISATAADAGAPVMQALALAGILGCATNASFFFLLGNGDTKSLAALSGVTGLATVVVAAVVLPRYGLRMAGVAAAASMVAQQGMLALVILPQVLGRAIRPLALVNALYAPVVAGLVVVGITLVLGPAPRGWLMLALTYAAVGVGCALAIGIITLVLPGRGERMRDLRTVGGMFGWGGGRS